jgi:hypothetical protein
VGGLLAVVVEVVIKILEPPHQVLLMQELEVGVKVLKDLLRVDFLELMQLVVAVEVVLGMDLLLEATVVPES